MHPIYRIIPPPPIRSLAAMRSTFGLSLIDMPTIKPKGPTHRDREIACSLAHANVLDHFLSSAAKYAVVLEDDAVLSPAREWLGFTKYDFFIPYATHRAPFKKDFEIKAGILPEFGTVAYLCSRQYAMAYRPRLLAGEVADHAMHRAAPGLRVGSYAGNIVYHDNGCGSFIKGTRDLKNHL